MNAGSPTAVTALEHYDVGVIQVDFSESHTFAIAACAAPHSNSCAIGVGREAPSRRQQRIVIRKDAEKACKPRVKAR